MRIYPRKMFGFMTDAEWAEEKSRALVVKYRYSGDWDNWFHLSDTLLEAIQFGRESAIPSDAEIRAQAEKYADEKWGNEKTISCADGDEYNVHSESWVSYSRGAKWLRSRIKEEK